MIKTVSVQVDPTTWPSTPTPGFPSTFHSGAASADIHIPTLLLLIGYLTTPPQSFGLSLSEYWAWVRYFFAVAPTDDLRISTPFAQLDSHQKTILSDDFGMGLPMYWLTPRLQFGPCCDGRYFAERYAAMVGASVTKTSKRGPGKSPDFIAQSSDGRYHVIECKGTQSGINYRDKQLQHTLPTGQMNGAVVQKNTITFPSAIQGQKLACGLNIVSEGSPAFTDLKVIDPDPDVKIVVREQDADLAVDPLLRFTLGRILRLSGMDVSATTVISPSGRNPDSAPTTEGPGRLMQRRREFVEQRRNLARLELQVRGSRPRFRAGDASYIGREVALDLPKDLLMTEKAFTRITIQQGLIPDAISKISETALGEGPINQTADWLKEDISSLILKGEGAWAELTIGSVYYSRMELS